MGTLSFREFDTIFVDDEAKLRRFTFLGKDFTSSGLLCLSSLGGGDRMPFFRKTAIQFVTDLRAFSSNLLPLGLRCFSRLGELGVLLGKLPSETKLRLFDERGDQGFRESDSWRQLGQCKTGSLRLMAVARKLMNVPLLFSEVRRLVEPNSCAASSDDLTTDHRPAGGAESTTDGSMPPGEDYLFGMWV